MVREADTRNKEEMLISKRALEKVKRAAEYTIITCSDATEAGRLARALAYSRLLILNAILEDE